MDRPPTLSVDLGLRSNGTKQTPSPSSKTISVWSYIDALDERLSAWLFCLSLPAPVEALFSVPACFFGLVPPIVVGAPWQLILLTMWQRGDIQRSPLLFVWTAFLSSIFLVAWVFVLRGHTSLVTMFFALKPLYILATPFNIALLYYTLGLSEDQGAVERQRRQRILSMCLYSLFLWYPSILIVLILKDGTRRSRPCLKMKLQQASQDSSVIFSRKTYSVIPRLLARSGSEGLKSFPSGDATSAVCFAIPVAHMTLVVTGTPFNFAPTLAAAMVILSCTGRVYFLAHHVSDVMVGAAIPCTFHAVFTWLDIGLYNMLWWYPLVSIVGCLSCLGAFMGLSKARKAMSKPHKS